MNQNDVQKRIRGGDDVRLTARGVHATLYRLEGRYGLLFRGQQPIYYRQFWVLLQRLKAVAPLREWEEVE